MIWGIHIYIPSVAGTDSSKLVHVWSENKQQEGNKGTLQRTNISFSQGIFEDDFPSLPRWDMDSFPSG